MTDHEEFPYGVLDDTGQANCMKGLTDWLRHLKTVPRSYGEETGVEETWTESQYRYSCVSVDEAVLRDEDGKTGIIFLIGELLSNGNEDLSPLGTDEPSNDLDEDPNEDPNEDAIRSILVYAARKDLTDSVRNLIPGDAIHYDNYNKSNNKSNIGAAFLDNPNEFRKGLEGFEYRALWKTGDPGLWKYTPKIQCTQQAADFLLSKQHLYPSCQWVVRMHGLFCNQSPKRREN